MRSGNRRGVTFALGLACALAFLAAAPARAQFHTIPDLVPAVDLNTGQPYYAPPIPYGHYAGKDLTGKIHKKLGLLHGGLGGGCKNCGGNGCDACGGTGKGGLFHKGSGAGDACGGPGACGGHGGLFHHKGGGLCGGGDGCGGTGKGGLFHHGDGLGHGHASTVAASFQGVTPAPPAPVFASAQCGDPGCGLGLCKKKCKLFDPCKSCGGNGCGKCRKGLGLCNNCGGAGCGLCSKARGLVSHLLGHDKIDWFVGPGGPVPLTPGYTPYVITTRSPRDFLAFPPYTP